MNSLLQTLSQDNSINMYIETLIVQFILYKVTTGYYVE